MSANALKIAKQVKRAGDYARHAAFEKGGRRAAPEPGVCWCGAWVWPPQGGPGSRGSSICVASSRPPSAEVRPGGSELRFAEAVGYAVEREAAQQLWWVAPASVRFSRFVLELVANEAKRWQEGDAVAVRDGIQLGFGGEPVLAEVVAYGAADA